jgi:hypothetical protein
MLGLFKFGRRASIGCANWTAEGFRSAAWGRMEFKTRPPCAIDFKRLMVNPMSTTKSRITGINVP